MLQLLRLPFGEIMILPARRRLPRSINYRIPGVWSGLSAFNPPARPVWVDPGYPPDPAIVAANTAANDAYQVAMQQEQAGANFDQCALNAQNANSPEQYAEVMARCQQQAEIQAAPMTPVVRYYDPVTKTVTPVGGTPGPTPIPVAVQPAAPTPQWAPPPIAARPAVVAGEPGATSTLAPVTGGLPTVAGFDLSKIPWWGWAAAAGAVVFMFGGGRGR